MCVFEDDIEEWLGDISEEDIAKAVYNDNRLKEFCADYFINLQNDLSFIFFMQRALEKKGRKKGVDLEAIKAESY